MKRGACPKCKSKTIYLRQFPGGYRSALVLAYDSSIRLKDYICISCGYVESYLESLDHLGKVTQQCSKVYPQRSVVEN